MPMMPRSAPLARQKASPATISLPVKSTTTTTGSKGLLWTVDAAPRLPTMYFLERTHVRVSDASPQEVASRIVECLRKQSVAAVYNDEEALVEAESQQCVQFAVRLWDSKNQVVVEVQRSCGCSFAFHELAKCVLRSAKGVTSSPPAPRTFALPKCIPRETEEERRECLREGLEIASSLLLKDALDSHMMALESLVHLTNVCKMGFAAESILDHAEILRVLLSLVEDSNNGISASRRSSSELEQNNLVIMRRQALTVLANCLDTLKGNGKLHACLNRHSALLQDSLVQALVNQVAMAEEAPHDACQAVRCLTTLTEASTFTRRRALELGAPAIVSQAHQSGQCRHAELQGLSSKLQLSMADL